MYKLLIVDDEEIERRAIDYIVKKSNDKISVITQAANGQEAISIASVLEPDIIIMDINMPGLDGIKASSVIKKFLPNTHIIFLTAFDEFNFAKEAIKMGATDFLVKPASPETLNKAINNSIKSIQAINEHNLQLNKIDKKLDKASKYLKEYFLEAMISGNIDSDKADAYLSFLNIDISFSYGLVVSLKAFNKKNEVEPSLKSKKQKIQYKLEKEINMCCRNYLSYLNRDYIYMFFYGTQHERLANNQSQIKEAVKNVLNNIYNEYSIQLDYGFGEIFDSIDLMWRSFLQAKDKFKKKKEYILGSLSDEFINIFAKNIIDNKVGIIKKQANEVQNALMEGNPALDDYKVKLLEFSILLKKAIVKIINIPIVIDEYLYIDALKGTSQEEGIEYLLSYIDKLCELCSKNNKDKNAIIIYQLVSFIENNIANHITLEKLSEISKMSTFYLSKMFKKHLNMNFIDYITFLRIKKAKNHLKNPYLSIKEISFKIGYSDPNYFTRVFKKETGLSPTTYRKQNIVAE